MIDKEFLTFSEKPRELPTVALRGLVVFPDMFIHFEVGREKSINALKEAMDGGQEVFLVAQRDVSVDNPDYDELYDIGVIAKVKQLIRMPGKNTNIRMAVEGNARARLIGGVAGKNSKCLRSLIVPVSELPVAEELRDYSRALVRHAKELFADYVEVASQMPVDIVTGVMQKSEPGELADYVAGNIMIEYEDRQRILEEFDKIKRLEALCVLLADEGNLLNLEAEIGERVQEQIDKNQREYYLREQRKIISEELGGGVSQEEELDEFRRKIFELNASDDIKDKLLRECDRLEKSSPQSPEAAVSRNYLEICLSLPWDK